MDNFNDFIEWFESKDGFNQFWATLIKASLSVFLALGGIIVLCNLLMRLE